MSLMLDFEAARCKKCGDAGRISVDVYVGGKYDHFEYRRCTACGVVDAQQASAAAKLNVAAENLSVMTFENFSINGRGKTPVECLKKAKRAAEAFATLPDQWLVFYGKQGTGKTHLLAAIKNYLETVNKAVTYISAPTLMDMCRSSNDPDWQGPRPDEVLRLYMETPVLLLDDLYQGERSTAFSTETWFKLLNHRYVNRMATAISTNINVHDPKDFDNQAIYDRFQHGEVVFTVLFDARSYRAG